MLVVVLVKMAVILPKTPRRTTPGVINGLPELDVARAADELLPAPAPAPAPAAADVRSVRGVLDISVLVLGAAPPPAGVNEVDVLTIGGATNPLEESPPLILLPGPIGRDDAGALSPTGGADEDAAAPLGGALAPALALEPAPTPALVGGEAA